MLDEIIHLLGGVVALPTGLRIGKRLYKLTKLFNEMPSNVVPVIEKSEGVLKGNVYTREGDRSTTCTVVNPLKNWLLMQIKIFFIIFETAKPKVG